MAYTPPYRDMNSTVIIMLDLHVVKNMFVILIKFTGTSILFLAWNLMHLLYVISISIIQVFRASIWMHKIIEMTQIQFRVKFQWFWLVINIPFEQINQFLNEELYIYHFIQANTCEQTKQTYETGWRWILTNFKTCMHMQHFPQIPYRTWVQKIEFRVGPTFHETFIVFK